MARVETDIQKLTDDLDRRIGLLADDLLEGLSRILSVTEQEKVEIQRVLNLEDKSITYKIVMVDEEKWKVGSEVEETCKIDPKLGESGAITMFRDMLSRFKDRFQEIK